MSLFDLLACPSSSLVQGLITTPEDAAKIADAFLEQEHGKPPLLAGQEGVGWWSTDVEDFLASKWGEIDQIEKASRSS